MQYHQNLVNYCNFIDKILGFLRVTVIIGVFFQTYLLFLSARSRMQRTLTLRAMALLVLLLLLLSHHLL